jgi:hypothetical protein
VAALFAWKREAWSVLRIVTLGYVVGLSITLYAKSLSCSPAHLSYDHHLNAAQTTQFIALAVTLEPAG